MTKEETAELIKRVCEGSRQTYERAQKKATPESKWVQIWGNCENAIDLVEADLLRELDKCSETEKKTSQAYTVSAEVLDVETSTVHCDIFNATVVSAMDVLGIVYDVLQQEREYWVEMGKKSGYGLACCKSARLYEVEAIENMVTARCKERDLEEAVA